MRNHLLSQILKLIPKNTSMPHQKEHWEEYGYLKPTNIASKSEMEEVSKSLRNELKSSKHNSMMNRHHDLPVLSQLICNNKIWDLIEEYLGPNLILWRSALFLGNPALHWHEDRHADLAQGEANNLSLMIALEDTHEDNCTLFVPGSHSLTIAEKEKKYSLRAEVNEAGNVRYEGQIPSKFYKPITMKAGQCILFHPKLLHASSSYVSEKNDPRSQRANIVLRVTTPQNLISEKAFPKYSLLKHPILIRGRDEYNKNTYS